MVPHILGEVVAVLDSRRGLVLNWSAHNKLKVALCDSSLTSVCVCVCSW